MSRKAFRILGLLSVMCLLLVIGAPISLEDEKVGAGSGMYAGETLQTMRVASSSAKVAAPNALMMPEMMPEADMAFDAGESAESFAVAGQSINQQMEQSLLDLEFKTYATSRMLVKSGSMRLEVASVTETVTKVSNILQEYPEGFIESKSQSNTNYYGRVPREGVHITARVPSEHFEAILESIQHAVGKENVKGLDTNAYDITDQYVDAASRADILQASRKALQTLLEKAQNVKEVMEVQRELNRIVEQYESQKKRAENLKTQSVRRARKVCSWLVPMNRYSTCDFTLLSCLQSLSTLMVNIEERISTPTPTRLDGFIPTQMVQRALHDMSKVTSAMGNAAVYYAVILVPLVLTFALFSLLCAGKPASKWWRAYVNLDNPV